MPSNTSVSAGKKILITGGAGFLGSHLCDALLQAGNQVICLDSFYSGNFDNIGKHIKNKQFKLVEHDISEPINMEIDEIYHFACPASPPSYQANPIYTAKTNAFGAFNVLDLALKNKAKILLASTSEVYGDPLVHPQVEEYFGNVNPIGIRSCYDEGKRFMESLAFDYHRFKEVDIKVIRIFNTYGPNMNIKDGRVVSNFICQALQGQDITIYGDGSQTRSFCYVADLVEAILRMMAKNSTTGPINLGSDNEFTIKTLAEMVVELSNSKSKIILKDLPKDDPKVRRPDINKARKILNWQPQIQLKEGLIHTIAYFKSQLKI